MHEQSCPPNSTDPAALGIPPLAPSEEHRSRSPEPTAPTSPTAVLPTALLPDASEREAFIAHLDALIRSGDHIETANGPLPIAASDEWEQPEGEELERMLAHERDLLASLLPGQEDHSSRWGLFRRRIGLRYDEPVPPGMWCHRSHRLIAEEIDAIFRGLRDGHTINAEAIRHGLRERAMAGRWLGDLLEMEEGLLSLLRWAEAASPLDFPIACDFFQAAKARQIFYPALRRLLERERKDVAIAAELQDCRTALNQALAILAGRCRERRPVLNVGVEMAEHVALASSAPEDRPHPISTGIPSLDVDMRGGILPGQGEGLWVLAARSGIGKTSLAIAAAMGLAINGAGVLFFSCELSRRAIGARLVAHYCRRANRVSTPLYTSSDMEGRGRQIQGAELEALLRWQQSFSQGLSPTGTPIGPMLYQSEFAATVEDFCALVEDTKAAHPQLSVVVLDHFHAMGRSEGFGPNTTLELAHRAMALKALAGSCQVDILVVGQLNRGAYGSPTPDVSHLAGTSELERFASAVWLLERPKTPDGSTPPPGVLEVHHGKFRHGQLNGSDLSRTTIRLDRAHCFLEADEARAAFVGSHLYPGVEAL